MPEFKTRTELNNFINLVRKMREYQKDFFKYKGKTYQKKAMDYEREVDKIISQQDGPPASTQGTLL